MQIRNVTLIGGSGFVGTHIAQVLASRGIAVTIPTRRRERAKSELIVLPTVDLVAADIHRDADLDRVIAGADAVVSLVGILHERRKGDFRRVHADLPRRIVEACERQGVTRLVHMSSLGADSVAPSQYQRTKAEGEAIVKAAAQRGMATTIFRPSVIFGRGDSFLSLFACLQRFAPMIALGRPDARFQPVWVEDVARAFADALVKPETVGETYELCGPNVYTLRELMRLVGTATGHPRPIIGLPDGLAFLQAFTLEMLPGKLLTRDNFLSMKVDNVCGCAYPAVFGGAPASLESVLPTYLGDAPRARYNLMRSRAGR
jgi:uncharacterized protein YbjT (DUF2867 family)